MPLAGKSFIAHQGVQREEVLARLLSKIKSSHATWHVGATVCLPSYTPPTARQKVKTFDPIARFALADPATHRLDLPPARRGVGRKHMAYLQYADPHKNIEDIVDEVLDAQVACERSVLISPWLTHGMGVGQKNLRATRRFAAAANDHDLVEGRDLLLGMAVHEGILSDEDERNELLDELVDWPERPYYFHVWVTAPQSYKQYANPRVLVGLREVVRSLARNGRRILLPQTGLFGWLMMPFGAVAFGGGISSSNQALAIRQGGGNAANRLEWYFLPQLLGFVLRQEVPLIAKVAGYQSCDCPFCSTLPLGEKGAWDFNQAGLHYLWWCAKLAAEQQHAGSALGSVRKRIAEAQDFEKAVRGNKVILDPRSSPTHLAAWSEVVG